MTNTNFIPSYKIQSSGNTTMLPTLKSWKLLSLLNIEWDMKLYFLHMKFDEVGRVWWPLCRFFEVTSYHWSCRESLVDIFSPPTRTIHFAGHYWTIVSFSSFVSLYFVVNHRLCGSHPGFKFEAFRAHQAPFYPS